MRGPSLTISIFAAQIWMLQYMNNHSFRPHITLLTLRAVMMTVTCLLNITRFRHTTRIPRDVSCYTGA